MPLEKEAPGCKVSCPRLSPSPRSSRAEIEVSSGGSARYSELERPV
ncbi:MAG: hypothetical protein GX425_08875 [Peptococcaceae bacterium]|nr:hypothetical protein [Peptococcaceae bacterium]